MRTHCFRTGATVALLWVCFLPNLLAEESGNWSQWRGPKGTGVAPDAKPPIEWSRTDNIRWKTPLPGKGHSTPVVWGNRIFLTTAIPIGPALPPKMSGRPGEHDNLPVDHKYQFVVVCIDRTDGSIIWTKTVHEAVPVEAGHYTASLASASPVTDGEFVFAHFGSHGLHALDFQGNVVWSRNFGQMHSKHGHGEGASPTLSGETLIINWDHEEKSFLVALDKRTGKNLWQRTRDEDTSWSSPIIADIDHKSQVIVCGTNRVRGYDLATGEVVWECGGMSSNIVATPVFENGTLFVGSSYEKRVLMAIDIRGATGDITDSKRVLWSRTRGTPYVPSMLLERGALYFLAHYQNVITRVDGLTGKDAPGSFRLGALRDIYSSPVAANGYVYVTDLAGTTEVITNGEIPRTIAVNRLEEDVSASLAIVENEILIRGVNHLYCVKSLVP